jgi:hypothetical protein
MASHAACSGYKVLQIVFEDRIKQIQRKHLGRITGIEAKDLSKPENIDRVKETIENFPDKEKLNEIHTPIIYILGGKEDIAYENGMDDFQRISHVPACATNFPVGHGGTYRQPHGGEFSVVALAWLDWQLKGDPKAAKMFVGKDCELSGRKDWTIEKNASFEQLKK